MKCWNFTMCLEFSRYNNNNIISTMHLIKRIFQGKDTNIKIDCFEKLNQFLLYISNNE